MGKDAGAVKAVPGVGGRLAELRDLLARGNSKTAFKEARRLHKKAGTPDTEALVLEAAAARARTLLERGLVHEARSLIELVRREHPALEAGRDFEIAGLCAVAGDPAALVAPLADPELPPERRRRLERAVERLVSDPGALARCEALPADHTLRRSAAAVMTALEEATSRSAAREPAALAEVPRRGPMAAWKLLVRAIRLAQLGDVPGCETCLGMMDRESAPGRLIPLLRALAHRAKPGRLPGPAANLWSKVHPNQAPLRAALERLDEALRDDCPQELTRAIGAALSQCQRCRPDLRERLSQHISVLAMVHEWPVHFIRRALRRPSLKNARFWRLFALAQEHVGRPLHACTAWSRFAVHATHEGWFAADGAEMAALYLHMADLLDDATAHDLQVVASEAAHGRDWIAGFYDDQPKEIRALGPRPGASLDLYFVSPHELYRRAAAIDSAQEIFARWLAWATRIEPHGVYAQEAAEAWHGARPDDPRPLLTLTAAAEGRGALRKALGYLDRAEALDALNPQVRRARFRLWIRCAIRHLRDAKPHLVEKDLHELDDMAVSCGADRLALIEAVRAVACLAAATPQPAARAAGEAGQRIGAEAGAGLLIRAVAAAARLDKTGRSGCAALTAKDPPGPLSRGVALACHVAEEVELTVHLPGRLKRRLVGELDDPAAHVDCEQALRLAEAALRQGDDRLAYAAAGAGLRGDEATPLRARLLLARAKSLPDTHDARKVATLHTAGALARRHHDEAVSADAFAEFRRLHGPWPDAERFWRDGIDEEQARAVLEHERTTTAYPREPAGRSRRREPWLDEPGLFDFEDLEEPIPRRRAGRKRPPPRPSVRGVSRPFERPPASMLDDLPDAMIAEMFGPDMPPAAGRTLLKALWQHAGPDGELPHPDELMERDPELLAELMAILDEEGVAPPRRPRSSRGGKRKTKKRRRR